MCINKRHELHLCLLTRLLERFALCVSWGKLQKWDMVGRDQGWEKDGASQARHPQGFMIAMTTIIESSQQPQI